jgi:hypothetical protein
VEEEPGVLETLVDGEVPGLLRHPCRVGMRGHAGQVDSPRRELMKNSAYSVFSRIVSTVKKSVARMPRAWARRNADQVGPPRRGAGPSP